MCEPAVRVRVRVRARARARVRVRVRVRCPSELRLNSAEGARRVTFVPFPYVLEG